MSANGRALDAKSGSDAAADVEASSQGGFSMLNGTRGRWILGALAIAATVASVVATSGPSAASDKANPPSNLRGEFSLVSHTGTQLPFEVLIKNFNVAFPNVKVDAQYLPPGATFSQPLLARINAGNAPDVLFTNPGPGGDVSAYQLGKAGKLLDLSGRPWVTRIPKVHRSIFYVGKKVYAEPVFMTASGVTYNTTAFKKLGFNVPTTFSQLLQLCGKAKAAGIYLMALPGLQGNEVLISASIPNVYASDPTWNTKRLQGKVTFASSPGWVKTLNRLIAMRNADCFVPGWQAANTSTVAQLLVSGKAVAALGPSAAIARYQPLTPGQTWASFPFPGDKPTDRRAAVGYNFSLSVSSTTKNRAAALAFIDFLGREGQSRLMARLFASVSLADAKTGKIPTALADYAPLIKAEKTVPRGTDIWPTPSTFNNLAVVVGNVLTGQQTPAEALKTLDDTWGK
jgi:raffinose/stachyose/melibiose transport system substrate-binding protein